MERSTSIRQYIFSPGSLIATVTSGTLDTYTNQAINGTIKKIVIDGGNWTATGSIQVFESGTVNNRVISITSGTSIGYVGATAVAYPFVYPFGQDGTTGSPQTFFENVVNAPLRIVGSGLGSQKSGLSVQVYYM